MAQEDLRDCLQVVLKSKRIFFRIAWVKRHFITCDRFANILLLQKNQLLSSLSKFKKVFSLILFPDKRSHTTHRQIQKQQYARIR